MTDGTLSMTEVCERILADAIKRSHEAKLMALASGLSEEQAQTIYDHVLVGCFNAVAAEPPIEVKGL